MAIRDSCFAPAENWTRPTGDEIKDLLKQANLSGKQAATILGLGTKGDRTVRRWTGGESAIPFTAWAIICHIAGIREIWK